MKAGKRLNAEKIYVDQNHHERGERFRDAEHDLASISTPPIAVSQIDSGMTEDQLRVAVRALASENLFLRRFVSSGISLLAHQHLPKPSPRDPTGHHKVDIPIKSYRELMSFDLKLADTSCRQEFVRKTIQFFTYFWD
jgi:hypothetical protein